MNNSIKKLLITAGAVILVIVCALWMFFDGAEQIEDINGPDNYNLAVIRDDQICSRSVPSVGLGKTTNNLNNTVKFSSKQFSGVYEVMWTNILFTTGLQLDILNYEVHAGNFKMAVLNEGKIVAELTPEDNFPVDLGKLSGEVMLVIAGESADFSFQLFAHDYDAYSHLD